MDESKQSASCLNCVKSNVCCMRPRFPYVLGNADSFSHKWYCNAASRLDKNETRALDEKFEAASDKALEPLKKLFYHGIALCCAEWLEENDDG